MNKKYFLSFIMLSVASAYQAASYVEPLRPSQMNQGDIELLQTSIGRMALENNALIS